jgi:hypothetical protein
MVYKRLLQALCGWVALLHLVLGAGGLFGGPAFISRLIRLFYGADLQVDMTLFYVAKLLAVYFLAFGALALTIALKPQKYLGLVPIVVGFFVLRLVELLYFYRFVGEQFLVPDSRLIEKIVSFAVIAVLMAFSAYRLRVPAASPSARTR